MPTKTYGIGRDRVRKLPTVERLRELLCYDPLSGELRWLVDRGGCKKAKAGDLAGTWRDDGYLIISIDGAPCLGHRIAWALVKGAWPEKIVDHENTDPTNNRWVNLREATGKQSAANRGVQSSSRLGVKGVRERNGRFLSQIAINGRAKFLGSFPNLAEAAEVVEKALLTRDGEFARS